MTFPTMTLRRFACFLVLGPLGCAGGPAAGAGGGAPLDCSVPGTDGAPTTIAQIVAGDDNTCVLFADGRAKCSGSNSESEVGNPNAKHQSQYRPVRVVGLECARELAFGAEFGVARIADGTLKGWGDNIWGELGRNAAGGPRARPVKGLADVGAARAGGFTTCVIHSDQEVECIGAPMGAFKGESDLTSLGKVVDLQLRNVVACAAMPDTTAQCWGFNSNGELGDGKHDWRTHPAPVKGLHGVAGVAVGVDHACARLQDGTVKCWGAGADGQNGDPAFQESTIPRAVVGLEGVTALAAGDAFSCAMLTDSSVACWGSGFDGELGNGKKHYHQAEPTPVAGLTGVRQIAVGGYHACALVEGNRMFCWGSSVDGELGNGTEKSYFSPVEVTSFWVDDAAAAP